MYNRYIPQEDGSYRKNRIPDPPPRRPPSQPAPPIPEAPFPPPEPPCSDTPSDCIPCSAQGQGAGEFLRRLLPKNLDTGDLLVILLLLLMAGDSKENTTTALLTLALYLFL